MFDLTIIILSFNTREFTLNCIESVFNNKWQSKIKVCLVDNNSSDETVKVVKKEYPSVEVIENKENLGFSAGNNVALRTLNSRYYLLLNSDTEIIKGALDYLVKLMDDKNFGIASCKLINPDGSLQPNAGDLPTLIPISSWLTGLDDLLNIFLNFPTFHPKSNRYFSGEKQVGWVSGAAMMIKNEVLKQVGYLDENIFMYDEDVDFCLRARKKEFKIGWTDKVSIIHAGGGSSKHPQLFQWTNEFRNLEYIYKKHFNLFQTIIVKILIRVFIIARIVVFMLMGKINYALIYGKVLSKI